MSLTIKSSNSTDEAVIDPVSKAIRVTSYDTEGNPIADPQTLWQKMSRDGKAFTTLSGFVTIAAATETDFFLMRNPASSGRLVRLKEFFFTINGTATQSSIFRFYRAPTITAVGTPLTINKVLATSSVISPILAYETPTISSRGTLIQLFSVDFNTRGRDQDLARYLPEGSDLLVTVQGSVGGIEHNILGVWAEEEI